MPGGRNGGGGGCQSSVTFIVKDNVDIFLGALCSALKCSCVGEDGGGWSGEKVLV